MKKTLSIFSLVVILTLVGCSDSSELKLPALFSDHMVLQQNSNVSIWGWYQSGKKVTVRGGWMDNAVAAKADKQKKWMVKIPTPSAGGPHSLVINAGKSIILNNIMIGEVWLCSGQSNMEMPLEGWMDSGQPILNSDTAIAAANLPNIRLFQVERADSAVPLDDCVGRWIPCSPGTVGDFSAVGFFFGRELFRELNVPIGLIHSSWGGTPSEAWTSPETLKDFEEFKDRIERLKDLDVYLEERRAQQDDIISEWLKQYAVENSKLPGSSGNWMRQNINTARWKRINVPARWDKTPLGRFTGAVWFRTSFNLPQEWSGKDLICELGPIDELDVTWINGKIIGRHDSIGDWDKSRSYNVSADIVQEGRNSLVIRVLNSSGHGGIFGKNEDLKIYPSEGTAEEDISLAGEWLYRSEFDLQSYPPAPFFPNRARFQYPSVLYNGMIHPLIPFTLKGAIWYQGESNAYEPELYAKIFPAMIWDWRKLWGLGDFPFYFVQIAPFVYAEERDATGVRQAQLSAMEVKNTGMVVTMDIGSLETIHPANKEDVGKRLALWALAKNYDFDVVYSGPIYQDKIIEGSRVRILFDFVGSGLTSRGGRLSHFEIAGADLKFVQAEAYVVGDTVIVSSSRVRNPVAVRYAWSDRAQPNLFNREGLPAAPFRTDKPEK